MKVLYKIEEDDTLFCKVTLLNSGKVKKEVYFSNPHKIKHIEDIVTGLIKKPNKYIAEAYKFEKTSNKSYYYLMEYIPDKVSQHDLELIYLCEDFGWNLVYLKKDYPNIIKTHAKLFSFINSCLDFYWDFHEENIRIDKDGNYKLIDYEGML